MAPGDVLLLRNYLLDEPQVYNENERFAAFYENSKVDQFLNSRFLERLEKTTCARIVTSNLEITAEPSVGSVGKETTTIPRKAFLLSHTEIAAVKSRIAAEEGKNYFTSWAFILIS